MAAAYNFHHCRQFHLMEARVTPMGQNYRPCQEEPVRMGPQSHLMEARHRPGVKVENLPCPQCQGMKFL